MSYFELYKKRVQQNGSSFAQRQRNNVINNMIKKFKKSPSYYDIEVIDLQGNIYRSGAQIIDDNSLSKLEKTNIKKIIMQPNDKLETGYRIKYNDKEWLCIKKDELLTDKGVIQEMNDIISWKDTYNKIVTYLAISTNQTLYSLGINDNKLPTVDGMLKLTLPSDKNTKQIQRGQRFIYKNRFAYEVTFVDLSMNGLINLTLKEVEINKNTDNLALGIADYYNRPQWKVEIKESKLSLSPNSLTQLHAVIIKDGIIVDEEIEWMSDNNNVAIVDSEGNVTTLAEGDCTIYAKLKGNNDYFDRIECEVGNTPIINGYINITGDGSVEWGQGKTFKAVKYLNGVEQSTQFIFTIDYMGNPMELCSLEIIDGATCKIVANTEQLEGEIRLIAVNAENAQEYYIKPILIKGFW